MTQVAATRKLSAVALIGAPILAVVMHIVGSLIAGVLVGLVGAVLPKWPIVLFILAGIASYVGMWVARKSTDVVFKDYSGRGVFIVFLVIGIVVGMSGLMVEKGPTLVTNELEMLTAVVFAYWQFWRREVVIDRVGFNPPAPGERRGLHRLWEPLLPLLGALPPILFMLMGLVQVGAVAAQVHAFTHLVSFLSWMIAFALTYVPIAGSVIGFFGARDVWGWQAWQAALLCFGPFVFFLAMSLLGAGLEATTSRR